MKYNNPKLRGPYYSISPVKVSINKDSLRNCHKPEETQGTWLLDATWDSELGFRAQIKKEP